MAPLKNPLVGQINPSQLLYTYGVGAIVDLPHISVLVTGLEDWPARGGQMRPLVEPRLLRAVRGVVGSQVTQMLFPPVGDDDNGLRNPFDENARIGVPVAPFPRWMLCPVCRVLAPISSGLFELKTDAYRADRARYEHINCEKAKGKPPTAVPARFLAACEHGHLDDFPWVYFTHSGPTDCTGQLKLSEYGASGEARDLEVSCSCGKRRRLADAFGKDNREANMPACRGRRPHLRDYEQDGCTEKMRAIILGASNSWFPVLLGAIAIPETTDRLDLLVDENWGLLQKITNRDRLEFSFESGQLRAFTQYDLDTVWAALERKRAREAGEPEADTGADLLIPEWQAFSQPDPARNARDFELRSSAAPAPYRDLIADIVLAERLREVQALIGFTRVDSPVELTAAAPDENVSFRAGLTRQPPTWVPAVDVRGEGLFVRFNEDAVRQWVADHAAYDEAFLGAHRRWRSARGLVPPEKDYPGLRYVLLHSFSHALMRQFALECGYSAASLRERIYAREPEERGGPMAGLLIYTAAPDSEGTLGGLVRLGTPGELERHLRAALDSARLCASDPTCAENPPSLMGMSVHAAACHACLLAPETSCERGNRFLDRSVLVATIERTNVAFFPEALVG